MRRSELRKREFGGLLRKDVIIPPAARSAISEHAGNEKKAEEASNISPEVQAHIDARRMRAMRRAERAKAETIPSSIPPSSSKVESLILPFTDSSAQSVGLNPSPDDALPKG